MEQDNKPLRQEESPVEESSYFEPSPKWKRVLAWILFGIVILGTVNWLISIAFPHWPQWLMEQFR